MRRGVMIAALLACRPAPAPSVAPPAEPVRAAAVTPAEVAAPKDDRDGDTIVDAQDRCPDEPEDLDQFEDEDGCVDRDNDRDGIPDAQEFKGGRWTNCDRMLDNGVEVDCRNRPEDLDGVADHDGCPDILCLDQCQLKLTERVSLDARGRFTGEAASVLDAVAATMRAAPDVGWWIEAHLDTRRDGAAARRVTQKAAEAVKDELVRRGVAGERLGPIGWGGEKPIDRSTTAQGRANNRRVEFFLRDGCGCGGRGRPSDGPPLAVECR